MSLGFLFCKVGPSRLLPQVWPGLNKCMSVAWHLLVVLRVLGGPEDSTDGPNHQKPDEDVDPQVGEQVAGPLSPGLMLHHQQVTPLLQLHLSRGQGQGHRWVRAGPGGSGGGWQTAPGRCAWGERLPGSRQGWGDAEAGTDGLVLSRASPEYRAGERSHPDTAQPPPPAGKPCVHTHTHRHTPTLKPHTHTVSRALTLIHSHNSHSRTSSHTP